MRVTITMTDLPGEHLMDLEVDKSNSGYRDDPAESFTACMALVISQVMRVMSGPYATQFAGVLSQANRATIHEQNIQQENQDAWNHDTTE